MKERWKMNRIGFVNFWLYDEATFEFIDGKLLLRGQNGSGKSITTQSFIPFVLDGDRTPNRLDPFGSSDRRMEYYFLGEEGKEESTGYLFLEFKKEESGEYRTIGIGQRAKRGKSMDFWGFVILDGRRIGYDLWLYKEVGTTKIPYDKREMKAEIGENNFFTDSQSEYKKYVNQYIFGFRKAEQYEQFIRLLVKVRAPKLSKEFKPTKVYDILNDSLQTLTDEDLRVMVDAMEKMDEIQDSLEMLNRAFSDVKIIRNEYIRYNQYMLAKKAQAYLLKKKEVESAQQQLESQEQLKQELEDDIRKIQNRLAELEEQKKLAEVERDGLLDTDLEEIDRKLEQVRTQRDDAVKQEKKWDDKIQECQERIRETEQSLKGIKKRLEERLQNLLEDKQELSELQVILQWDRHDNAIQRIAAEDVQDTDEIAKSLVALKKLIEDCKKFIRQYEDCARQYDILAGELEELRRQKLAAEEETKASKERVVSCIDQWIMDVFQVEKDSAEWHPAREVLEDVQQAIREYRSVNDAGTVQELLHVDYEKQRQALTDIKRNKEYEQKIYQRDLEQLQEELLHLQAQEELEPVRDENSIHTREVLQREGITAVPFYKTVEFAKELDAAACARIEAQLQKMGILDALVAAPADYERIREKCPEFLDTILYVSGKGASDYAGLVVSEEIEGDLKEAVVRILSHIYEEEGNGQGVYLGKEGCFRQGILTGKAEKTGEAEFVGLLARKRRKEQKLFELQQKIQELMQTVQNTENEIEHLQKRVDQLQEEYQSLPDFSDINESLNKEKECSLKLQSIGNDYNKKETQERSLLQEKNRKYQEMLHHCKGFPYERTEASYEEVSSAIEEYRAVWQNVRDELMHIASGRSSCRMYEDNIDRYEEGRDDAFSEKRQYGTKIKECEIQIRQMEEYLNQPEIVEKAKRLRQIKEELEMVNQEHRDLSDQRVRKDEKLSTLSEKIPEDKGKLQNAIAVETCMRTYFEEELSLKLVLERESRTLSECAKKATGMLRESDKNREASDLLQALNQVYQQHNGSLIRYGTALEDCFGSEAGPAVIDENISVLRKRMRVVSVWNGKKVYLEEFYEILKTAIDETESLIQAKDRELFEDILSKTISQQLTDRIAESRRWVADMSQLMKEMDTSMGLSFSLDWKPCKAENDMELDTAELEQILLRDRMLLTTDDIEKVAAHFRSKIRAEKLKLQDEGGVINYMELVRDALDYRKWFEFQMFFRRGEEQKKPLSNAAFNRFSGGEKAMAMYVPLFAAINAQYEKAENKDYPRMMALDEAFAGVDDKNISSMFELVHKLDFDYIMNSQALWGCFETVRGLRIAELLRPQNSQTVSVIRYIWNGHERILDEQ